MTDKQQNSAFSHSYLIAFISKPSTKQKTKILKTYYKGNHPRFFKRKEMT